MLVLSKQTITEQRHRTNYIGLFGACDNATQKQLSVTMSTLLPNTKQDRKKKASLKTTEESHASTGLQTHDEAGKS